MTDPISAGGKSTIRYFTSTGPALITMPVGLCIPIGGWLGSVDGGVTTGFTAGILLAISTEYLRRGTIAVPSPSARRILLSILTAIYRITPVLAGIAVALGVIAVNGCFGPTCAPFDHFMAEVGLVIAIISSLASAALISLLRSPVWAQQVAASAKGP